MAPHVVGVDVSKAALDVHVRPEGTALRVPNSPAGVRELAALGARRRQLTAMLAAEKNRLAAASSALPADVRLHVRWLHTRASPGSTRRSRPPSPRAARRVCGCRLGPAWAPSSPTRSPPGCPSWVGWAGARARPWWGSRPTRATRAWLRGTRAIWGGRAVVRSALYLAAMSGVRCDPTLRPFYRRLVAAGEPRTAALTATAHKLLTILNTRARAGSTWTPPSAAPARQPTTVARWAAVRRRRTGAHPTSTSGSPAASIVAI